MTTSARTSAQKVLNDIEKQSEINFLPIIGPVKGPALVRIIGKYGIKDVLEVGALVGYSAILMAGSLPADGHVVSVEKNPESARIARGNIEKAGLNEKITLVTGDALKVIPGLNDDFDLVFIDAAKDEYLSYLQAAEPLLRRHGVVFADNAKVFADQMSDYLAYVRESGKYQSRFVDFGGDGVEISVLKS